MLRLPPTAPRLPAADDPTALSDAAEDPPRLPPLPAPAAAAAAAGGGAAIEALRCLARWKEPLKEPLERGLGCKVFYYYNIASPTYLPASA
jgi:hypothetical protein